MSEAGLDTDAFQQLNAGQKQLLDTIDNLRKLGVGNIVDLPQIIVVGDQSSGKSSVLEAISRVRFPIHSDVCTRFATELVLRKASRVQIEARIIPAAKHGRQSATEESTVLEEFHETSFSQDALPDMIEKAKAIMGIGNSASPTGFSEDILRIEISGPDTPPLTLVDLPGFYHSSTSTQSAAGIDVVKRLARKYMRQQNTIILAVVSADHQLASQAVLDEAQQKECDRERVRTLGIITKPDKADESSAEEARFIKLARNKDEKHKFKLGWHVLRNRSHKETDIPDAERDENEQNFLASSAWQAVQERDRGIESLRRKLSKVLVEHIQKSMPDMVKMIGRELSSREKKLGDLGDARSSPEELRRYLSSIAANFHRLAQDAIRGTYTDAFFGGLYATEGDQSGTNNSKKLRAALRDLNRGFTIALAFRGHSRTIMWSNVEQHAAECKSSVRSELSDRAWLSYCDFGFPPKATITSICADLQPKAAANQGMELPGSPNQELAFALFREHSKNWGVIANRHATLALEEARALVEQLVAHTVADHDHRTRNAILYRLVDPFFDKLEERLAAKVDELLMPYTAGFPEPLEDKFLETREQQRSARQNTSRAEGEDDRQHPGQDLGTTKIVEDMEALYHLSREAFTQNVITLGVENCLVRKIPELLTPQTVVEMSDERLHELAAESEDVASEREECQQQLRALRTGLDDCRKHMPRDARDARGTRKFSDRVQPRPSVRLSAADEPVGVTLPLHPSSDFSTPNSSPSHFSMRGSRSTAPSSVSTSPERGSKTATAKETRSALQSIAKTSRHRVTKSSAAAPSDRVALTAAGGALAWGNPPLHLGSPANPAFKGPLGTSLGRDMPPVLPSSWSPTGGGCDEDEEL